MRQKSLFDSAALRWERIEAPDAELVLLRDFVGAREGDALLDEIIRETPWRQDRIKMFGKEHDLPRLQQWFGDAGRTYVWSGIKMEPLAWMPTLTVLRKRLEALVKTSFNSVLVNYYRSGADTVGWHADDEPELGPTPLIASVSLGAERDFILRHRDDDVPQVRIVLPHGSLLLMSGPTQQFWQHSLPRRKNIDEPRINLTFRTFGDPHGEERDGRG